MNFLKDLNPKQLEAVTAPLGPVLILAGAGSGKTRALTYRIAYLVSTKQFTPERILAVTFTNKAAKEIVARVEKLVGDNVKPTLGTFHSVCARILRREIHRLKPFTPEFTIFDSDDSLRALKTILGERDKARDISPTLARAVISSIKNRQITPESLEDDNFIDIYQAYEKLLQEVNALDFDDLLLKTVVLFREHPKVLQKYQMMWPYILIDEYQDTNNLQYDLIKLLTSTGRNIFAVGDDAQSIYGFRGANYQNILNFEKDFKDAFVVTLDQNYRSTGTILSAANEVIKLSRAQKQKNLWTNKGEGSKIVRYTAIDEVAEAMFVAGEILAQTNENKDELAYVEDDSQSETPFFDNFMKTEKIRSRGRYQGLDFEKLKETAVLYRTNAQSRVLEEVMLRFGIPYHLVGSVRFYERREIKDLLSFLRLISNPRDILSLERVINIPPRGLGERSFQLIRSGNLSSLTTRAANSWQSFSQKLESLRSTETNAMLVDFIRVLIVKLDLESAYRDGTTEGEDRWENVKELLTVASKFNHLHWQEALKNFLEEVALYSETDEVGSINGITLMTLHQAKGLEFDTVFMVGLEEGLLPHMRSLETGGDISEEIRLAYVGMTRAREKLYLLNTYTRRIFGTTQNLKPSRVLKVLPEDLVEYKDGWG